MIRDIYSRSIDAPKYNDQTLEVSDTLSQLIIKIENCLFTNISINAPSLSSVEKKLTFQPCCFSILA